MLTSHLHLVSDRLPRSQDRTGKTGDYFKRLFREAPAACIVTNSECIVLDANHAAETMLLSSLSEMLDTPFRRMIAVSDRQMFEKMAAEILLSVMETSRPLCVKPSTGGEVDVLFKASVIRDENDLPELISWIFLESLASGSRDLL